MQSYGTSNVGQAVDALRRNAHSVAGTGISSTCHRTAALPGVAVIGFQGSGKSSTINALIRHWSHQARGNNEDADMEAELAQLESSGVHWLQLLQCDRAYRDGDPDSSKQALDECNRVVRWSDGAAAAVSTGLADSAQDIAQDVQWDAQAGLEGPRHLDLALLNFDALKADYLAATGNEGHTSITSAAYGPGPEESVMLPHISPAAVMRAYQALQDAVSKAQDICRRISEQQDAAAAAAEGDSSEDEDHVSMADATNCLHKEPVRLALRLLGHFQPAEQLRAFTDMMQMAGPVTFPSALRDVMGCTYTYRPAQQAAPMPPQLWRVLAKRLSLAFLQPAYNPLCAALQGCRVSLGSPDQCGMHWSLMDTRGTSTTSAAQLRHLEAQGLMPVSAALFLVASSPEGEASAGDMHQLAKSMLLTPALRSLASRPAAAAAAAAGAGATVPAAASSSQLPIALVLLGDKVFADALSAVRRAYDAARTAAAAACLGQLITQNDAEQQLQRCSRGESATISAAAAPDFWAACNALQQACRVLQDRQQRGERNLLGQLVQRLRWQPQCMGATEAAVEACVESGVRVITLYPRCVSGSHPGFPKLGEQQGGYTSLQEFLQQVAGGAQWRAAEQEQLQQLQDLAAAATAVFRGVPELCSMAVSASSAEGGAAGDPEQLLQLLQTVLQPRWVASIEQLSGAIAPGGCCHRLLQGALLQQLQPQLQRCTPEGAVAAMVLAFAPELAQQPDVAAALRAKGLLGVLDHPAAAMVLVRSGGRKGLIKELRKLLIQGISRPPGQDMSQQPITLHSCVFAALLSEAWSDSPSLNVDSQLQLVRASMQDSSSSNNNLACRAAAEKLCRSTDLPPFVELGVQLADSLAVSSSDLAGLSELQALCVNKMVAALQQALLAVLQQQLQPVSALSRLQASAQGELEARLEQLVKSEVCCKLERSRGFNTAKRLDAALQQLLAPQAPAASDMAAAASSASTAAAAPPPAAPSAAAAVCADVLASWQLGFVNTRQLQERVELFHQGSGQSAAELLTQAASPLLAPHLLDAVMHTAAVVATQMPDMRDAAESGGFPAAAKAQYEQLCSNQLVCEFDRAFESTATSLPSAAAGPGAQLAGMHGEAPRPTYDLALLPQLISRLQLPADVVASFQQHLHSITHSSRGITITDAVIQESWEAWQDRGRCPSIQLPVRMLALAADKPEANQQQQQQQPGLGAEVAGRHVAVINLLAWNALCAPSSGSSSSATAAAAAAAAAAGQGGEASSLVALQQQLAAATQRRATNSSAAADTQPLQPLQLSGLHLDLLCVFASGDSSFADISSQRLTMFDQRYSYLWQVAAGLPGPAFKTPPKPVKPGQWLVLTGSDITPTAAATADAASQASSGAGSSSSSRVYARVVSEQGPEWLVEYGTAFERGSLVPLGQQKLSKETVLLAQIPGVCTTASRCFLNPRQLQKLLTVQPLSAIEAALRAFCHELQRLGLPLDDTGPLLQRVYGGDVLGPGWQMHVVARSCGMGQERIFVYTPAGATCGIPFSETGFLSYAKSVSDAKAADRRPPDPSSMKLLSNAQKRSLLRRVEKHTAARSRTRQAAASASAAASAAGAGASAADADGDDDVDRPAQRRRIGDAHTALPDAAAAAAAAPPASTGSVQTASSTSAAAAAAAEVSPLAPPDSNVPRGASGLARNLAAAMGWQPQETYLTARATATVDTQNAAALPAAAAQPVLGLAADPSATAGAAAGIGAVPSTEAPDAEMDEAQPPSSPSAAAAAAVVMPADTVQDPVPTSFTDRSRREAAKLYSTYLSTDDPQQPRKLQPGKQRWRIGGPGVGADVEVEVHCNDSEKLAWVAFQGELFTKPGVLGREAWNACVRAAAQGRQLQEADVMSEGSVWRKRKECKSFEHTRELHVTVGGIWRLLCTLLE